MRQALSLSVDNAARSLGGGPPAVTPDPPVALVASSMTGTGMTANWNAASGATSYKLDVSTAENFGSFVSGFNNLTVAGTSQAVTGLSAGTIYYFRVRAVNSAGTSGSSNIVFVVTTGSDPAFSFTAPASGTVEERQWALHWTNVAGNEGYACYFPTVVDNPNPDSSDNCLQRVLTNILTMTITAGDGNNGVDEGSLVGMYILASGMVVRILGTITLPVNTAPQP